MAKLQTSAFGGQVDDAEAVLDYMKRTAAKTDKAATLRSQFLTWYANAGFWDKNFSKDWYDEMRSRKNAFDIANATTPKEAALVERVLTTGMTAEEMQGKPRPNIDVKTGLVGTQIKNPSPALTASLASTGFKRNLKKGVTPGDDVKQWQSFLGIAPVTGYFDAVTDTKTREYQKKNGLVVDGIVGKNTWGMAFPKVQTPFAPAAPVAAALTPAAIKGSSAAAPAKQPAAAAPGPAKKPATPASSAAATATSTPVAQAGIAGGLMNIGKWPLWAKITGGLATLGAVAYGVHEHEKKLRS